MFKYFSLLMFSALPAFAQDGGLPSGLTGIFASPLAPMILLFVVFYFFLIRPQQKKTKEHREMLGNLRRGDRVITSGGIIGTVSKIEGDHEVEVEIAKDIKVRIVRNTIMQVIAKTEPATPSSDGKKSDGKKEDGASDSPSSKKGSRKPSAVKRK